MSDIAAPQHVHVHIQSLDILSQPLEQSEQFEQSEQSEQTEKPQQQQLPQQTTGSEDVTEGVAEYTAAHITQDVKPQTSNGTIEAKTPAAHSGACQCSVILARIEALSTHLISKHSKDSKQHVTQGTNTAAQEHDIEQLTTQITTLRKRGNKLLLALESVRCVYPGANAVIQRSFAHNL